MPAHSRQSLRTRPGGYSLVELVLVVAIAGTLSAIALPRYGRGVARYRADAAAKRVASDLQLAQQRARAASASCSITFDTTASAYTLAYPTIAGVAGRSVVTNLTLLPFRSSIQSASFAGSATVTFNGYGKANAGGTVVLKSGSETRTITLSASAGAVTIN